MYVRTDLRSGEWSIMEICLKKKSTGHWSLLWALVNFKYVHDEYPRLCGQEQYRDYDAAARFWTRTQPDAAEQCLGLFAWPYCPWVVPEHVA